MAERSSWPLILLLWGAGLGAAAQYGKISVIFDLLPQIYPDAGPALGWVVSLVGCVGILFGVVAGVVVARIRYRRAMLTALWIGAAVSLFQASLPPLPWMLLSRVVEGASHLAIVVAAPTLIAQLCAPQDRGLALTLWGTFFGVAFAVLAFAGHPLAHHWGVPALFVVHAVYMAIFAILLRIRLRALPDEGPQPVLSLSQILRDHVTIYRSPFIAAPAAGWLFYTFSFVSVLTLLPPFLDPAIRALVMTAMPLTSIAISMTVGVALLRVVPAVRVVELGFALSALCMIWLWAMPALPLACIALAAGLGLVQGASFAAVPQLNSTAATQARANGAMAQMGNIGNTLGTPVIAMAIASAGYQALPLLVAVVLGMGFGIHLLLGFLRRSQRVLL
ncbi:MFS transporter [Sulfitobacter geojensis]|uniref:MFS transporter n=1 Tax=Sulfitobacter geojensis TaxID=1342299 RepID=UPI0004699451|nr:MFS transporter [Sulfitobacter geojensis]KHA52095.1 Major facilitator superfamily [Sulfitobacter geojensis]NYI29496.1 putative MFS family arabinose efflux permease [Sulfitobacter geojensis]